MADNDEDAFGDIPPLENMSEEINRRFKTNTSKVKHSYLEAENNTVIEKKKQNRILEMLNGGENTNTVDQKSVPNNTNQKDIKQNTSDNETFCGFKKGFLLQSNKSKSSTTRDKKPTMKITPKDELIEVKKNKDGEKNKYVLPDVQQAMNEKIPNVLKSKDWVTPDLLDNVMKNPKLAKHFNDPNFNEAISLFQTNPQKVMEMCNENAELREFIGEFANLMGNHFTNLGEQQNNNKSKPSHEDEKKIEEILKDDEIKHILQKNEIQKLLFLLKTDPEKGQRFMKTTESNTIRSDIQRLIDVGLVQFVAG